MALTRPKVDHDVYEENGVGKTVEGDPARAEVVVEERDGHGQDYQVGHKEQQHTKVPVKSENKLQGVWWSWIWVGLTMIFVIPLSARFSLGR